MIPLPVAGLVVAVWRKVAAILYCQSEYIKQRDHHRWSSLPPHLIFSLPTSHIAVLYHQKCRLLILAETKQAATQ